MIDRRVLTKFFTLSEFPTLMCPRCQQGSLTHNGQPEDFEPNYSKNAHASIAWETDWVKLRLPGILVCSNASCGELVIYSADGILDWDVDEYGEQKYGHYFKFQTIHPAIWIIEIPSNVPVDIKQPLISSFDTFWNNKALSGNALRQAIEALLDYHGVARKSSNGNHLTLASRISTLKVSKPSYSDLFELFRPFLNAGSHGEDVELDTMLNVYEALEIHLVQAFDDKSNRLTELQRLLKASQAPKP